MGLISTLKHALGLGPDEEDLDEYDSSTAIYAATLQEEAPEKEVSQIPAAETDSVTASTSEPVAPVAEKTGDKPDAPPAEAGETRRKVACTVESLPADLFDAVIERFNAFQPEFVRACLDVEAERRVLMADIAARLESAPMPDAASQTRIDELEALVGARDHTIREKQRYVDSLERQKGALLERITVLEDSARLANVRATRGNQAPAVAPASNEADKAEIERLSGELKKAEAALEQLELKSKMADKMLSDERNAAAESRKELEAAVETHQAQMAEMEAARLTEMQKTREAHQAEIDALKASHAAVLADIEREQAEAVTQIEAKLAEFEDVKARFEARISELKASLKSERDKAARLSEEVGSLRSTIETNLYNQANSEMRLRSEIKALRSQLSPAASAAEALSSEPEGLYEKAATDNAPAAAPATDAPATVEPLPSSDGAPKRRRGRPRKRDFEEELDNPSGFIASTHKDDPEFGYHEPPRRPANDSSAQLSLF